MVYSLYASQNNVNPITGYIQNNPNANPDWTAYWGSLADQSDANGQYLQGALWRNLGTGLLNGGEGVPPSAAPPIPSGGTIVMGIRRSTALPLIPLSAMPAPVDRTVANASAKAETGPVNVRVNVPVSGGGGGGTQTAPFIPPNYPELPQVNLPGPANLPQFSAPSMPHITPASTMPVASGGTSGGTPPSLPVAGQGGSAPAPWNVAGGDGGGGIPLNPSLSPMQAALHAAMQGRETPGMEFMAKGPGGSRLVPPPPPYMPTLVPDGRSGFTPQLPPNTPVYSDAGGGPMPLGAVAPPITPAAAMTNRAAPPQPALAGSLWDETPETMRENVDKMYGKTGGRNPYGESPEEQQAKLAADAQKERDAINERYAPKLAQALMDMQRARQRKEYAQRLADDYRRSIQMLQTREGLEYAAGIMAQYTVRQQNATERGIMSKLGDLANGRLPARLTPEMQRLAMAKALHLDSLMANRDDLLNREYLGLQSAEKEMENADKALESARTAYNNLVKIQEEALKEANESNHRLAQDMNAYRSGMSDYDRDMANVGVDRMKSYLDYRGKQMSTAATIYDVEQRDRAADLRHEEHEEWLDLKNKHEESMDAYRNRMLDWQLRKGTVEGMTQLELLEALKNATKSGQDARIYGAELARRNGDLPGDITARRYIRIYDELKAGKITDDQVRERGVDPDKLRDIMEAAGG
jgi:hypothetical protein